MTKLGALLLTPIGFAVGGFAGQVVGLAFAMPPGDSPGKYRHGVIRPYSQRELEWERNGGMIGAAVGATLMAVLAAGKSEPPKPGTVAGLPLHDSRFP